MRVGFVGWRGMVGSVLMQRMQQEGDFETIEPVFFSTSSAGGKAPAFAKGAGTLRNANDAAPFRGLDAIVTCQGGDWTSAMYPKLRDAGFDGYWIDAASTLRMHDDAVIVLDPVNRSVIDTALDNGVRNFIGGNCTVSLMLMSMSGLFREGLVAWVAPMTYQAASGAGAQAMRALAEQMGVAHASVAALLADKNSSILDIDRTLVDTMRGAAFPTQATENAPLAGSLLPWIDKDLGNGMSREEWKGGAETNKILGRGAGGEPPVPIDSICVRVGAMRCHSQSLTIRLKSDVPLADIEAMIAADNPWVHVVPNTRTASTQELTPVAVTGTMRIPVGRLRKLAMGERYLGAFTIGDQLL